MGFMLKIRLQRVGRKHDPSFRVVLTDSKSGPQSGKYIEILGSYDARTNKAVLKTDEIKKYIANGAQPSDTIHNLLIEHNVIEGKKVNALPKKSPIVSEKAEEETAAAPTPAAPAEASAESAPEAPAEEAPTTPEATQGAAPKEESAPEAPVETPAEEATEEKKEEAAA